MAFSAIVGIIKSWIPKRSEPANVSRNFWMPDRSCRVCYECDTQFTVFNRRHHCRLCGRVFCGRCTANFIPADNSKSCKEEPERIRVCSFCLRQNEQRVSPAENAMRLCLSPSFSSTSFVSTKSSWTISSTNAVGTYSTGSYNHPPYGPAPNPGQSVQLEPCSELDMHVSERIMDTAEIGCRQFGYAMNRSDDEYYEYEALLDSETLHLQSYYDYGSQEEFAEVDRDCHSNQEHPSEVNIAVEDKCTTAYDKQFHVNLDTKTDEENECDSSYECNASPSIYDIANADAEPVDFENNGLLWLPPDPEDEEDERGHLTIDDEEDNEEDNDEDDNDEDDNDPAGEWRDSNSLKSFNSGECHTREQSSEEHKKTVKNVVDGHFRALIAELLLVENLPVGEDEKVNWLDIVTSLSWEAANFLKPDTSNGARMDPGGYVKVKCLAYGHCNESKVVKGVVCKKNVANRRMKSIIEKPRFLLLGGALEYQRVLNMLSSIDTLLQQEMDHLKMAVAKIVAHQPNVLLVEKSVSRSAQDYLLAKDISLVLNIKRPLLERIARCTGAEIVPSIDHLSSPMLGHCDLFHVEKYCEDYGPAAQSGKKVLKNLMFFEGCPKPLGCTVLLKGANVDELKKVKHVVHYGVFAAYHLALETSFLADEGAFLPDCPLKTPIRPSDKPSCMNRSTSLVPGHPIPAADEPQGGIEIQKPTTSTTTTSVESRKMLLDRESKIEDYASTISLMSVDQRDFSLEKSNHSDYTLESVHESSLSSFSALIDVSNSSPLARISKDKGKVCFDKCHKVIAESLDDQAVPCGSPLPVVFFNQVGNITVSAENSVTNGIEKQSIYANPETSQGFDEMHDCIQLKEELTPSSDHESILVSLSTRCVWKGTICERSQLFRIKYYSNRDRPLGRYLRDLLFDESYRCPSCDMPSEAHVHCYTHRQGSLTISVRKLPDIFLPGEGDGKIWMWHRCLMCPRSNGFPPSTRRVVMSDAAWGLSFGKFLELSFSNHAAASRVASCGHSLHKDCLRFYGFGRMVACFRYASIQVHSVYLPPPKVDFNYQHQEWITKEANEVVQRAENLFGEIYSALCRCKETISLNGSTDVPQFHHHIIELEDLLQNDKSDFEDTLHKALKKEVRKGEPIIDILEINKLKRQLLFHSYLWDQRLSFVSESENFSKGLSNSFLTKDNEKLSFAEKAKDLNPVSKLPKDLDCSNADPIEYSTAGVSVKQEMDDTNNTDPEGPLDCYDSVKLDQAIRDMEVDSLERKPSKTSLYTSVSASEELFRLESGLVGRRTLSDGQFPVFIDLSGTLDARWTGDSNTSFVEGMIQDPSFSLEKLAPIPISESSEERTGAYITQSFTSLLLSKLGDSAEDLSSRIGTPFVNIYRTINKNWGTPRFNVLVDDTCVFQLFLKELERQGGARFLLSAGINDTVIPIYDDEPTSIISYALVSSEYHFQMSDERDRMSAGSSPSLPLYDSASLLAHSFDEIYSDAFRSFGPIEDNVLSLSSETNHIRISFTDEGPLGKAKYAVTCYFAKRFDSLRRACCPSELDFIRSLSRCKKWGAQGGKSNVFFAKSLDDRFIVKQVTKTELESFIKFAPEYFKYLSHSIATRSPTCLAKVLGIYQVNSKNLKGGKDLRMDVLVMENLLFGRNLTRLYDLKGSSRSRYNPDSTGNNTVLLDQNLIESMPTSPIFVGNKAKRLLERAVWNDTSFLTSVDVMDYSLLVGMDEENHELVVGIIDFMRQYTWDKHLETWVKASGILGGPKNVSPTVISPKQYKKRFRKAMSAYFLVVPDQWTPPAAVPNNLNYEIIQENQESTIRDWKVLWSS